VTLDGDLVLVRGHQAAVPNDRAALHEQVPDPLRRAEHHGGHRIPVRPGMSQVVDLEQRHVSSFAGLQRPDVVAPAQAGGPAPEPKARQANQRKLVGRVVSNKMQKTVVVKVERRVRHAEMGKTITRSRKYHAHVEEGQFGEGDLVEIAECRPVSRTKSWRVTRLVEKSKAV